MVLITYRDFETFISQDLLLIHSNEFSCEIYSLKTKFAIIICDTITQQTTILTQDCVVRSSSTDIHETSNQQSSTIS